MLWYFIWNGWYGALLTSLKTIKLNKSALVKTAPLSDTSTSGRLCTANTCLCTHKPFNENNVSMTKLMSTLHREFHIIKQMISLTVGTASNGCQEREHVVDWSLRLKKKDIQDSCHFRTIHKNAINTQSVRGAISELLQSW